MWWWDPLEAGVTNTGSEEQETSPLVLHKGLCIVRE